MDKLATFEFYTSEIRRLDFEGHGYHSEAAYRNYQLRNSFGLVRNSAIHRIFQRALLRRDMADGCLTLPRAGALAWKDTLENPLSAIHTIDSVTGTLIHWGALTYSYHAICWTHRVQATASDWVNFSHGEDAIRVSTTVGKLMDRVMRVDDPAYAFRAWLIKVEYENAHTIQAMQNPQEIHQRMDGQGGLLAQSAALVRTDHSDEDEVRLLLDPAVLPEDPKTVKEQDGALIRIPFDWTDFIEFTEGDPFCAS